MATICRNCATPLVFDPGSQKVVCPTCGGSWNAEEVEAYGKELLYGNQAVAAGIPVNEGTKKEFLDCYIYTCSSCGGEIIINGSEASTKCVYCGGSSVVFDRISKEKAPEYILPFAISREQALDLVKQKFSRGMFIPKEVKNFTASSVRGIYIPYWIVNAYHVESDIVRGKVKSGKSTVTRYFGRSGRMHIANLPVDASRMLSDESSQRLEPFDFSALRPFDEDYLLGFYSNVSDLRKVDLQEAVNKRAQEVFAEEVVKSVRASSKKVIQSRCATSLNKNMHYAMLPVWFITYDYQGKHNTIMVNGQTGKVVCGVPWNERAFKSALAVTAIVLSLLLAVILRYGCVPLFFITKTVNGKVKRGNPLSLFAMFGLIGAVIFFAGKALYKKVKKQLELSQSTSIFNFMKKRQE